MGQGSGPRSPGRARSSPERQEQARSLAVSIGDADLARLPGARPLLRTGCPWRYLPRDSFPPRSTVYNIFRKFQREGVWEAIWAELHAALRERLGREASPTAGVLDSQTLKSAEKGAATT